MPTTKPPLMFWIIAIVALLWNLMGCWNYIGQTDPDAVAQMSELYRVIIENRPTWATAGFAISVYGGAVGAILLLLRRRLAISLFVISALGTAVTFYFTVRVIGLDPATGSAMLMSLALIWFAAIAQQRGWTL